MLAALCAGYFLGGYAADRYPSPAVLGTTVAIGSVYLLLLPAFSEEVIQFFAWQIDDIKMGSLAAALAIMLFPVTFLGMYSPFAIRLLMDSKQNAGAVSGTVYGFHRRQHPRHARDHVLPDPADRTRAITLRSAFSGCSAARCCWSRRRRGGGGRPGSACSQPCWRRRHSCCRGPRRRFIRSANPRRYADAQETARIRIEKSVYNDIFVTKEANLLKLGFQWKGWHFYQSEVNLADPDDLPMLYARVISIAVVFPQDIKRVLVLGLGAGSVPVYLQRFVPKPPSTRSSSIPA